MPSSEQLQRAVHVLANLSETDGVRPALQAMAVPSLLLVLIGEDSMTGLR